MTESQKVIQEWETPSLEEIPVITKAHVEALETTGDPATWSMGNMHHVLVRTVGRKTGNEHKVALPFWRDADGRRVVVASFAGAPGHPAWYLNLADRQANPEVLCTTEEGQYWSVPDILDGEEYQRIWSALLEDRAWYADYQAKTERRIPLVGLPETRPA